MTQVTEADREAAAQAIAVQSQMHLRDAVLRGDYDKSEAVKMFAHHREQAVQEAVAERDARIEGLTIERDFHRETADLHAARIAELEAEIAALKATANA